MPEARNGINPLKPSLLSQFFHRIKVEMYIPIVRAERERKKNTSCVHVLYKTLNGDYMPVVVL